MIIALNLGVSDTVKLSEALTKADRNGWEIISVQYRFTNTPVPDNGWHDDEVYLIVVRGRYGQMPIPEDRTEIFK